jgi:hypothetical protein
MTIKVTVNLTRPSTDIEWPFVASVIGKTGLGLVDHPNFIDQTIETSADNLSITKVLLFKDGTDFDAYNKTSDRADALQKQSDYMKTNKITGTTVIENITP